MPLILAILGIFLPRLTAVLIWLFTNWFSSFETVIWPLLGFILMPYTLLAALYVELVQDGVYGGFGLILLIIAIIVDLFSYGGNGRTYYYKKYRIKRDY